MHDQTPATTPGMLRVGDRDIAESEIAREMQHHRAARPEQARLAAAQALIVRELLRCEIAHRGLREQVRPQGRETDEEAAIRCLVEQQATATAASEADCRRYFEQNRQRLRAPDRIRVRHILLAAAPDDVEARLAARDQAERLIGELRQHPERFCEFAQRHSACPSKHDGGALGWLMRGQTTPEFDRQLFMLKPGLAGLSVESRWGHHVVCVDAIERGATLPFAEARPRIAEYLELQQRQNAIRDFLLTLAERYGVTGLDAIEQAAA